MFMYFSFLLKLLKFLKWPKQRGDILLYDRSRISILELIRASQRYCTPFSEIRFLRKFIFFRYLAFESSLDMALISWSPTFPFSMFNSINRLFRKSSRMCPNLDSSSESTLS